MIKQYTYKTTPLGALLLLGHNEYLVGLYFVGKKHMPAIQQHWKEVSNLPVFMKTYEQLIEFMNAKRKDFTIRYWMIGTPFQQQVWAKLTMIPYGTTLTYQTLALQLGKPQSVRAVANAVGRNPLSIILPCHRVIGSDGTLTGYAGGLACKRKLLDSEQQGLALLLQ